MAASSETKIILLDVSQELPSCNVDSTTTSRTNIGEYGISVPQPELDLFEYVALNNTHQSCICRYLLYLLIGAEDPSGFVGQGLLEMKTLDQDLADAFLTILDWWRGPTKDDSPLFLVLGKIERTFRK